jgi:hypothetical protein
MAGARGRGRSKFAPDSANLRLRAVPRTLYVRAFGQLFAVDADATASAGSVLTEVLGQAGRIGVAPPSPDALRLAARGRVLAPDAAVLASLGAADEDRLEVVVAGARAGAEGGGADLSASREPPTREIGSQDGGKGCAPPVAAGCGDASRDPGCGDASEEQDSPSRIPEDIFSRAFGPIDDGGCDSPMVAPAAAAAAAVVARLRGEGGRAAPPPIPQI